MSIPITVKSFTVSDKKKLQEVKDVVQKNDNPVSSKPTSQPIIPTQTPVINDSLPARSSNINSVISSSFNPQVISLDPSQILNRKRSIPRRQIRQLIDDDEEVEEKPKRKRRERSSGFNWNWLLGLGLVGGALVFSTMSGIPAQTAGQLEQFPHFESSRLG